MRGIMNAGSFLLDPNFAFKVDAIRSKSAIMLSICATLRRFSST